MTATDSNDTELGKQWFAERMWEDLPEDAKERLRGSDREGTGGDHDGE